MSFQAYLDAVEAKTGLTPRELIAKAHEAGFDASSKSTPIVEWLASEYGLGKGHAMSIVYVITKGSRISEKHVGTDGVHRDESVELWLDGKASKPAS